MNRAALLALLAALAGAAEISGIVYDDNGDVPLNGITIFADGKGTRLTVTDAQGRFTVPVPPGEDGRWIVVWREDVVGASYWLSLKEFADKPVRVAANRGTRLTVRVTDPEGRGVPGAELSIGTHVQRTGDDGVGYIGPLARHAGASLEVKAAGYETENLRGIPVLSYREHPLVVVLKPKPGTKPPAALPAAGASGF